MIPLISDVPRQKIAFGVILLILVNIGIHTYNVIYPNVLLFADYGFSSIKLSLPSELISLKDKIIPFFSYSFIHTNYIHLLFNIMFLFIFGINVENKIGTIRFIIFYMLYGIFAAIFESIITPNSSNILVGASGAVAGIIGMSFVFYPFSNIKTYIIPKTIIKIHSVYFVLFFFLVQFMLYFGVIKYNISSYIERFQLFIGLDNAYIKITNVSLWAPVGGLSSGMFFGVLTLIVIYFRLNKRKRKSKNTNQTVDNSDIQSSNDVKAIGQIRITENDNKEYVVTKAQDIDDYSKNIVVTVDKDFDKKDK